MKKKGAAISERIIDHTPDEDSSDTDSDDPYYNAERLDIGKPLHPPSNTKPFQHLTGFGGFLLELASLLTLTLVQSLAILFEYPKRTIDEITKSADPSMRIVHIMEERGQISPNDISQLTSALESESLGLFGLVDKVKDAFDRYQSRAYEAPGGQHLPRALRILSVDEVKAKNTFISELKRKYENLYEAVQPIPYIRDKLLCVARVYVEGGIEYFVGSKKNLGQGKWKKLTSYQDIFKNPKVKSRRRTFEADPGFGKSTITLQIAYDWCNKKVGSFLYDLEILILLQLKRLGGYKSIYTAIRTLLLPKDSTLTEEDVKRILHSTSSVLVVFDGFDEYPDRGSEETTDVKCIIKRDMFQEFDVLLTTRTACLPQEPAAYTKRIRLTGFDEQARDTYIRKVADSNDDGAITKIKNIFSEKPILADMCEIPLFFVMFAHVAHKTIHSESFNSVTAFFRHIISCFHHHMINKLELRDTKRYKFFQNQHQGLDQMAFEGLNKLSPKIVWRKETMLARLGEEFYDYYVSVGILVEEIVLDIDHDDLFLVDTETIEYVTTVQFFHKLFCEWYAAHYLSHRASKSEVKFDNKIYQDSGRTRIDVAYLDPFELQYIYRFACGMNSKAAKQIIKYLQKEYGSLSELLCILEECNGNVENIIEDVSRLCRKHVQIRDSHNMLLQRTTLHLLNIASNKEIPVSELWLYYSFSFLDPVSGALVLKSQLRLHSLNTLQKLVIVEDGKKMTLKDVSDILQYSSLCTKLRKIWFVWCLLPRFIHAELVSPLQRRTGFKVSWSPGSLFHQYLLNLKSGLWERTKDEVHTTVTDRERETMDEEGHTSITDEEYRELVGFFEGRRKTKPLVYF